MKGIIILLAFFAAVSSYASEVVYPVKNFKFLSDRDYREEVQESEKYVVMVFSSKECLERTIIDRSCFMFEKKLDYFVPSFRPTVKVVAFNTYFDNYQVANEFRITKNPTVIIIKNNQIIKRFESTYVMGWQDEMLKDVLNTVSHIF